MVSINIISKENIKPSSPTPQHLKLYNLSILDQLIPAPYAPIILYYQNQDHATELDVQERLNVLKDSLSKTLTRFYPLAGTIKDDLSIDCNDVGAYFVVANVNTKLEEFLTRPDYGLINHFLPQEQTFDGSGTGFCVSNVQVTLFECCGMAISLCISHKIVDGASLITFLHSWAGTSYGSNNILYPNMNASFIFPAKDLWLKDTSMVMFGSKFKMGKCSTTRFVFDASKLAILKAKANGSKNNNNSTRVEVVTALLWKCVIAASEEKSGLWKPSLLSHVVNLRKKMVSSLSENSIGNLIWLASAECKNKVNDQRGLCDLVEKVRDSVSKINSEFVKSLQGEKGTRVMEESLKSIKDCVDYTGVTSWCKMGFYEVDFGWGKPVWVCGSVCEGSPVFMNFVILMDTKNGDGIEAWVTIDEHEMCILKNNLELLEFAIVDPSPLLMI